MKWLFDLDVARLFRSLILFEAAALVAGLVLGAVGIGGLPPALREFTAAQDERLESSPFFPAVAALGSILLVLYPVSLMAMWRFKRIGLFLYLASFVLFPLTFLMGTDIVTPGEQLATELSMLCSGMLVGLAFHPEIRRRFAV